MTQEALKLALDLATMHHTAIEANGYSRNDNLYTTPPQRTWVGLTDEEIHRLDPLPHTMFDQQRIDFARAIEANLKEKNT